MDKIPRIGIKGCGLIVRHAWASRRILQLREDRSESDVVLEMVYLGWRVYDITLLKWQDDIDGLVSWATNFQTGVHERSSPTHSTPVIARVAAEERGNETFQHPDEHWQPKCDCSTDEEVLTQIRSDLEEEIPEARAEIQRMSGLTLSMLARSRSDMSGVDRRSLFEAEAKGKRRLSVCIYADLDLSKLGDMEFRIKVDRSFTPPASQLASGGNISGPNGAPEVLTVDSSRLEHNTDMYFFFKVINVSSPMRITVLEGQAVTVRDHHELLWVWIPAGNFPALTEVPNGVCIEVIKFNYSEAGFIGHAPWLKWLIGWR
ncbi:hypothetical protein QC764_0094840 [Podospora pseudoanserina]|uniref:Uncharacterized protein n=1 Tax=Podospora pseudoanserina TaxID=2609844 RepID=A0ABR0HTU2_9PEZI|nr:hypothetical protein QC764_0094840 [Podospora pseudoanserina]